VGIVRTSVRVTLAGLAAAGLAACGGGTGTPGSGTPASAELVADGVPVFVAIDGNFDSEQWTAVEELLQRFPSGGAGLDRLFAELAEGGVDFNTEVKPALGPEVAIALTDLPQEGDPPAVLLTQPADPAKFEALLAQADEPAVWRIVDGWYVVADDDAAIEAALSDGESLAASDAFESAMEDLPGDALVRLYLDGPALTEAAQEASAQGAVGAAALGLDAATLESVGLALSAEPQGIRLDGVARSEGGPELEAGSSELVEVVPADAVAFGAVNGLEDGVSKLLAAVSDSTPELAQAELLLGISLEDDVVPLFAGESGFYVRAGEPIPEVTLLLSPEDPEAALATVDRLLAAAAAFGALGDENGTPQLPAEPATVTIAGVEAKQVRLGEDVTLTYAIVDGRIALSTSERGIADVAGDGPKLAGSPAFDQAREAAGLSDEALGLVYLDLNDGIALLEGLDALDDADSESIANLQPLQYLVLGASGSGDEARFAGFLGIG
jgi:Protein of unknown function (DUF3352)